MASPAIFSTVQPFTQKQNTVFFFFFSGGQFPSTVYGDVMLVDCLNRQFKPPSLTPQFVWKWGTIPSLGCRFLNGLPLGKPATGWFHVGCLQSNNGYRQPTTHPNGGILSGTVLRKHGPDLVMCSCGGIKWVIGHHPSQAWTSRRRDAVEFILGPYESKVVRTGSDVSLSRTLATGRAHGFYFVPPKPQIHGLGEKTSTTIVQVIRCQARIQTSASPYMCNQMLYAQPPCCSTSDVCLLHLLLVCISCG